MKSRPYKGGLYIFSGVADFFNSPLQLSINPQYFGFQVLASPFLFGLQTIGESYTRYRK